MSQHRIIFFDPGDQPYGNLSPYSQHWFYPKKSGMMWYSWRSCQQYLLAQQFVDSDKQDAIRDATTLQEAQALAAAWIPRDDWDDIKIEQFELATRAKFADNLYLQYLLVDTGNAELIYADPEDTYWGIGSDGNGTNNLGKLLMALRAEYKKVLCDPSRVQCPNDEGVEIRQACIHLLKQPPGSTPYYRYYSDKPGYFALICSSCFEEPENIPNNLRWICKNCFIDYIGQELGQIGEPQFLSRPSNLHFTHHTINIPGAEHFSILDIQPIENSSSNCWIALTHHQKLIQINFETRQAKLICKIPKNKIDWSNKVVLHVSRNGKYAAIANLRGQYGIVVDLTQGKRTIFLDRGEYYYHASNFPLAFAELDGRHILVHGTDWNRLTISDPASGKELTARKPSVGQKGAPSPEHGLDYFHGRLAVSPDQDWIADWGWVWHPVGMIRCWSLRKWLNENVWESEDAYPKKNLCYRAYYWDGPMCWADSHHLIVWGHGEDELTTIPAATICDAHTATELSWFVGPTSSNENMTVNEKSDRYELSAPAGTFIYDQYLFSIDSKTGMTVWDIQTGEQLLADKYFYPQGYHTSHKCFVTIKGNGQFMLSKLESQNP